MNEDLNFTLAVTAAAWALSEKMDDEELALAAAALTQAADTLAAIAVLRAKRKTEASSGD